MKYVFLVMLFMCSSNALASNVQWGLGEHYEYTSPGVDNAWGFCMIFTDGTHEYLVDMLVHSTLTDDGCNYLLDFEKLPGYVSRENIISAEKGDVITSDNVRGLSDNDYLIHHRLDDEVYNAGAATVKVIQNQINYLAIITAESQIHQGDDYVVGWLSYEVDADGKFQVINAACDLDGGPMIVGGGSAIPEPSAGLLLLLGCSLLALRRRKSARVCLTPI